MPPSHRLRSANNLGSGTEAKEPRKRKKNDDVAYDASSSQDERTESIPLAKRKRLALALGGAELKSEPGLVPPSPTVLSGSPVGLDHPKKKKRIPYTLVEASKGNRCPTDGCDGHGHITGLYAMHFAISGCPKAHGKTAQECKARREELNRLRSKNMPHEGEESGSSIGGVVFGERSLRRAQRSAVEDIVKGTVASLSAPRKIQSQVHLPQTV